MKARNLTRIMLVQLSKKVAKTFNIKDFTEYGYTKNTTDELVIMNKKDGSIISIDKRMYNLSF